MFRRHSPPKPDSIKKPPAQKTPDVAHSHSKHTARKQEGKEQRNNGLDLSPRYRGKVGTSTVHTFPNLVLIDFLVPHKFR